MYHVRTELIQKIAEQKQSLVVWNQRHQKDLFTPALLNDLQICTIQDKL
jgi:hypothetical protein